VIGTASSAARRRGAFRLVALALSLSAALAAVIGVDVWLHARYAPWLGYNVWGYRGPIAGRKQPGEYRVAVFGGSVAYGYSVAPADTIEMFLERDLRAAAGADRLTVVNLAYNNEGAYSFAYTVRDYAYLKYDLAILFEGYNDLTDDPPNRSVFRQSSPVFRLTGYLPIFPMVFREKAAALMYGGDVNALYEKSGKRVFRPAWTARTQAGALTTAAAIEGRLERQLARISPPPQAAADRPADTGCAHVPMYCRSVAAGVDAARAIGAQVIVGTQPYVVGHTRPVHMQQQQDLAGMLSRKYGGDPNVKYVNLGGVLDLSDPRLSGDGMHPTDVGDARLAEALVQPVLALAAARARAVR
jgi:hypothetical protein